MNDPNPQTEEQYLEYLLSLRISHHKPQFIEAVDDMIKRCKERIAAENKKPAFLFASEK